MEGPNSSWGIKEQETRLTLHEHCDDFDDDDDDGRMYLIQSRCNPYMVTNSGVTESNDWAMLSNEQERMWQEAVLSYFKVIY
jgi:hypothetical protein